MVYKVSLRIKIAIIASLISLAILLLLQLADAIPASIHIFPASLSIVLFIFAVSYFLPLKKS